MQIWSFSKNQIIVCLILSLPIVLACIISHNTWLIAFSVLFASLMFLILPLMPKREGGNAPFTRVAIWKIVAGILVAWCVFFYCHVILSYINTFIGNTTYLHWSSALDQFFRTIPGNDPQWIGDNFARIYPDAVNTAFAILWQWTIPGLTLLCISLCPWLLKNDRNLRIIGPLIFALPVGMVLAIVPYFLFPVPDPWVMDSRWIGNQQYPPGIFGDLAKHGTPYLTAAFPSMHVAWNFAVFLLCRRVPFVSQIALFFAIATAVVVLVLRLHWTLDVIAGLPMGYLVARGAQMAWGKYLYAISFSTRRFFPKIMSLLPIRPIIELMRRTCFFL